jgi:hypothetical protein
MARLRDLAVGVLGLLAFAWLTVPAIDPDYGWHVANGRHLLDGVLFAGIDVYSWTSRGATWIAHEWLTEGVMATLNDRLGPTANSLLAGSLGAAAVLLTASRLRRRRFGTPTALLVGALALLDAGTLVSVGPAAVEVAALAWILWLVDAWRSGTVGTRAFGAVAIITALAWANAHGSFVLGLGVLGATWLGLVSERDPRARAFLGISIVAGLVTLANPFGPRLIAYVLSAQTGTRLSLITEWQPPDLAARMWWAFDAGLVLAALGAAISLARWVARRRAAAGRRGDAAHPTTTIHPEHPAGGGNEPPASGAARLDDLLIALVLAIAGLVHARHAGILVIGAAPLIAAGLAWLGGFLPAPRWPPPAASPRARVVNLVTFAVLAALTVGLAWARVGPSNTDAAVRAEYPVDALPALDVVAASSGGGLRLLNDYSWGGWLEMTRPGIPVFIDGRSEVYGDAQLARYALILGLGPGWDTSLDATGANAALIHASSELVPALEARGWSVRYADAVAALLIAPNVRLAGTDRRPGSA